MPLFIKTSRALSWRRTVAGILLFMSGVALGALAWQRWMTPHDPQLDAVVEAWHVAQAAYVRPVDEQRLRDGALQGMALSLDPHSEWWSPRELVSINDQLKGQYGGVGIRFRWVEHGAMLVSIKTDGPADRAGLRKGDVIVAVNGHPVNRETTTPSNWRGKAGSVVVMTVERSVGDKLERHDVTMEREEIQNFGVEDEAVRLNPHDGAWIRIRVQEFQESTVDEVAGALRRQWAAERSAGRTPAGVVLDLRGSPGGLVQTSLGLASLLMGPDKTVVVVRERYGNTTMKTIAFPPEAWSAWAKTAPVVIWTDHGTASAAEIMVAALRDQHRAAWVIGEPTFGKGSVQTAIPLENGGDFKLTTGLYTSPNGTYLQGVGEVPDVLLVPTHAQDPRKEPAEKNLPGALTLPSHPAPVAPRVTVTLPDNAWSDAEVSDDWFWKITRQALDLAPSVAQWHGQVFPPVS